MKSQTKTFPLTIILALSGLLLFGATASVLADEAELRTNSITEGQGIQRGPIGDRTIRYNEFDALVTTGAREKTKRADGQSKTQGANTNAATPNVDFWFYDVDLQLFSDTDGDGYFYGIDLLFDADTVYLNAEVYAVIYLSYEGGPWNEYADTANFNIFGASSDDEYVVVSELVSGYPTGDYDILIELFDTFDNSFVASIGPEDTSKLSFIPLEDIGRDTPFEPTIVVNHGGGGAFGGLALAGLLALAALRRRQI